MAGWQENDPISIGGQIYGDGVTMPGGVSQRDRVLEQEVQQQNQATTASASRLSVLDQVQTIFNQTTTANSSSSTGGGCFVASARLINPVARLTSAIHWAR